MIIAAAGLGCVHVDTCSVHEECAADEVCWQGMCELATERYWTVEIVAAEVDGVHPDGNPWDPNLGAPDLYADFGLPWDRCVTSIVPESFEPVWMEACDFYVPYDGGLAVDLWDADGAVDELGASFLWEGPVELASLARTDGWEVGYVDESGSVLLWSSVWLY